jgi:hypothetical protein
MSVRRLIPFGWYSVMLLALAVGELSGQEPRFVGRVPDAVRGQVDAVVDSARAAGLPAEVLIDRALEGASKGATGQHILAAVRRLALELGTARDALGSGSTAAEVMAGASALRAGATARDLAHLRAQRSRQSLTVAAAVLADLVAVGVPVDTAIVAVLALAEGADDTEYIAFRRNVERDIALGASPVAALGVRLDAAAELWGTDRAPPSPRKP